MRAVILAGGLGTRLAEETESRPKPMVEIGGRPILWHIMSHYAAHWVTEFVVALGYKGEVIKRFFLEYTQLTGSLSVNLARGEVTQHEQACVDWTVHLVETGLHTNTGGRVRRLANWLKDDTFMLTYGDGVSDVDVQALLRFHRSHGRLATVTAVRPPARFGGLEFDGDFVTAFTEKPQTGEGWINGGFFVLEPKVLAYLDSDDDSFEADVLTRLAAEGQLAAYRHDKFWQCMDTLRDKRQLDALWQEGRAAVEGERMTAFWHDRPTLVTGATGLVGGWVVRKLLAAQADVVCLVRDWVPESEFVRGGLIQHAKTVRGDVCDQAMVERVCGEYEIDTVIHLAAQTLVPVANRNPVATFETNIAGTWALLEACRRSPKVKQIVFASSDKAYGDAERLPYDESTPLIGRHPYDVSKSCADLIAQSYAATYGLPVAITRCGNFYGPGDLNWNRIVPGTVRSVLRGERPVIRSDGQHIRDYFYVEDGAAAYLLLAEKLAADPALRGEAFNFSNETQVTVLELVEKVLSLMGSRLTPDVRNEASNEIRHQSLSAAKAREWLGWRPLFSLDDGLRKTIAWYSNLRATRKAA